MTRVADCKGSRFFSQEMRYRGGGIENQTGTLAFLSSSTRTGLLSVTESAARSRLMRGAFMPETQLKPSPSRCSKCGEQLRLITVIFDALKGRTVHLLGCKCGDTTWIPEMT
jgi:hypothetical protein